jgi:hypothetical protein
MNNKILILLICILSTQAFAYDDSFEINKDGYQYLCTVQNGSGNGSNAAECVEKAYSGPFSRDESLKLCTGARNAGPALCALKAYSGPLSKEESLGLCTSAYSTSPADCFSTLYSGPFSKEESIRACSQNGDSNTAQCVLRAYAGPYSKEQALKLCARNPSLLNVALSALHNEKLLGFGRVIEKANLKAISNNEFRINKNIIQLKSPILSIPQK